MDTSFCEQIDREFLVEEYVQGKLHGDLLAKFVQHLKECDHHAMAVRMEQVLKKGVTEFARSQLRASIIRRHHQPQENVWVVLLRYAAFLFVAVFVPLMLYYQFQVIPRSQSLAPAQQNDQFAGDSSLKNIQLPAIESVQPVSPEKTRSRGVAVQPQSIPANTVAPSAALEADQEESEAASPPASPESVTPLSAPKKTITTQPVNQAPLGRTGYQNQKEKMFTVTGVEKQKTAGQEELLVQIAGKTASAELTESVSRQISAHEAEIKNCLSQSKPGDFVMVEISISREGQPREVKIIKTNLNVQTLENCLQQEIKSWKFAPLEGESVVLKTFRLN